MSSDVPSVVPNLYSLGSAGKCGVNEIQARAFCFTAGCRRNSDCRRNWHDTTPFECTAVATEQDKDKKNHASKRWGNMSRCDCWCLRRETAWFWVCLKKKCCGICERCGTRLEANEW